MSSRALTGLLLLVACGEAATSTLDGGPNDTGVVDTAVVDTGVPEDTGVQSDAGVMEKDAGGVCPTDPDCASCAADGECCYFSINCRAGSICNLPTDDLYDPEEPEGVCIAVACRTDADCEAPEVCSLSGLCEEPICQVDGDCGSPQRCIGGACQDPPDPSDVASCEVVSKDAVIRSGFTIPLHAIARDAAGDAIGSVSFSWSVSGSGVVVSGASATGQGSGTAVVTASAGSTACTDHVRIISLAPLANQRRVVVVDAHTGEPIDAALVTVHSNAGVTTATTSSEGALILPPDPITSVTVSRFAYRSFTVIGPPPDVLIPLPRIRATVTGGRRGYVDLSPIRQRDIGMGLTGTAHARSLTDPDGELFLDRDFIPTFIDAPELGVQENVDLPAGLVWSLGTKHFTADGMGERCAGEPGGANLLGCFAIEALPGRTALWSLTGSYRLSQITTVANELSEALNNGTGGAFGFMFMLSELADSTHHAIEPTQIVAGASKVNRPGSPAVDCSDPHLTVYDRACQADRSQFPRRDVVVNGAPSLFSVVSVPDLAPLPGGGCNDGLFTYLATDVPGAGLVPMGLRVASDVVDEASMPDCRVDGREIPFGPSSTSLDDGEVALIAAPLHSGAEGFAQYLIVSSRSTEDSFTRSTIVQPIDRLETRETVASDFVSYPTGSVSRANRQLDLTVAANVTRVRVDFVRDGTSWIVFAPPGTTALPSTLETDDIAANAGTVYISALRPSGVGSPFDFGEPARIDLAPDAFNAIASVACSATGELCALED